MSDLLSDPPAYARQVAGAARGGLESYLDACALLRSALTEDVRSQRAAARELTQTAQGLGMTLIALARTLEEIGAEPGRFAPEEDPRLVLGLVRTIAESMVLMAGPSLSELVERPLADPDAVRATAARPAIAAFLALAG